MNGTPIVCEMNCDRETKAHSTGLIVITGGPGAGKTAMLEMAKKLLCEHVVVLPEAASIVFGGGFWRLESPSAKLAAQKAIYHVQRQMENLVLGESKWAVGLCDRGTLDGLAYWNEDEKSFWAMTDSRIEVEYARYLAVIHLRSPSQDLGYNYQNPLRIETANQAMRIDNRIYTIWSQHPRYKMIESTPNFLDKAHLAIKSIFEDLPECCKAIGSAAGIFKCPPLAKPSSI